MSKRADPYRARAAPPSVQGRPRVASKDTVSGRHVIRHISVSSVFTVSATFYIGVLITVLVAGIILWQLAAVAGFTTNIRHLLTAVGFGTVKLNGTALLVGSAGVGVVLSLLGALANVFLAVIYNVMSKVVGGIEIDLGRELD